MRIAVFSHYFYPEIGAPSARIGDMGRQWVKAGHEVHIGTCFPNHPTGVVYPGYNPTSYHHEIFDDLHVHRCRTYITPNRGLVRKTLGHATLWLSARHTILPRLPRPDVTLGTSPTFFAAMAARDCARRFGVPFVIEVRDLWPAIFIDLGIVRNRFLISLLERWEMGLYRSATRIVTVSDAFRRNIESRGIPGERIVTIPNGANADEWQPTPSAAAELRQRLGLEHSFVVLYIGAHGISQGLHAVVKAAEMLHQDHRFRFVFVGEGAERSQLIRAAKKSRLTNVQFLDPVDRQGVQAFYTMADLCLVPLRAIPLFEAFIPSKMFEIMAMGRPILASVQGEAADILRRSSAAHIVPPEDSAAISEAIRVLAADPNRLRAMGEAGREFVKREYSRATLASRYIDVMDDARRAWAARR